MPSVPKLNSIPSMEWLDEWDRLMEDKWLSGKLNRRRRMAEHVEYIDKYLPEIKTQLPGVVIDIGPGAGELLELAEMHGHAGVGVDSPDGVKGMGHDYVYACRLMHVRQCLSVHYGPALEWLKTAKLTNVVAINLRGSIEQVFAEHMRGDHSEHHDCSRLSWLFSPALREAFRGLFTGAQRMLRPGGALMIYANGAQNTVEYDGVIRAVATEFEKLKLVRHEPPRVHKWEKV